MGLTINPFSIVTDTIGKLIDRLVPDKAAAERMKLEAAALASQQEFQMLLAQLEVNKVEAGTDKFRGGWRPCIGWVGAIGLAYEYIIRPILTWASLNFDWAVPPVLNIEQLLALITAMLGIGGYRTIEKLKGME
jgi:Holin of 3TMs, for gene-transfer release